MVPLLENAKQRGLVKHSMYTIALRRDGAEAPNLPGGTITYGDLDTENCGAVKVFVPSSGFSPQLLPLDALSFEEFQPIKPVANDSIAWFRFAKTYVNDGCGMSVRFNFSAH